MTHRHSLYVLLLSVCFPNPNDDLPLYQGLNVGHKAPAPRVPPLSSLSAGDNGVGASFGGGGNGGDNIHGNDGDDGMDGNGDGDGGGEGAGSPRGLALGSVFGRLFDDYNAALDKNPLLVKGEWSGVECVIDIQAFIASLNPLPLILIPH